VFDIEMGVEMMERGIARLEMMEKMRGPMDEKMVARAWS